MIKFARGNLVVEDSKIAGHDLVLEDGSGRNVYPVAMICNDDNCSPNADPSTEGDVPGHCEVVQFKHVGYGTEP